ncbi:TPA: ead/Ea22-like family protein [Serratia marcescens]
MDKFSELKAAAMAATPGPWFRSSVQFNGITTEATFITQGNKPHVANTSEKRDAIFIAAANPAAILALLAELEAKDKRIAELSRLLAHNIERSEEVEKRLATPVRLPRPACTYADHSYPAYSRKQVEEIITSAGMRFTVEGDE